MAERLKTPAQLPGAASEQVRRDVSEMLLRIDRRGERPVREYSGRLDAWDPPSFVVTTAEIEQAAAATDGAAVLFAAEPTLMTGASLRVDGGWTAR
jgi:histidinol dehydrogenase